MKSGAFADKFTAIKLATGNECYEETIRHVANAANGKFGEDLLRDVAFLPLEATFAGLGTYYKEASGKVALLVARYVLTRVKTGSFSEANQSIVAGLIIDSFYKKAVSDDLSTPLTKITWDQVKLNYEPLGADRVSQEMTIVADYGPHRYSTQMDMNVLTNYDPLTHIVSGAVTSKSIACLQPTYIFQFRLDEDPDFDASFVLEQGDLSVYDLEMGQQMPSPIPQTNFNSIPPCRTRSPNRGFPAGNWWKGLPLK